MDFSKDSTLRERLRKGLRRFDLIVGMSLEHHVPENPTDLTYWRDRWFFLVGLILSIRCRDSLVNSFLSREPVRRRLRRDQVGRFSVKGLQIMLRPFGLSFKARAIMSLSTLDEFSPERLMATFGVGRKVVDVYSNVVLGGDNVAVDTHTLQFFNRLCDTNLDVVRVRKILNTEVKSRLKGWFHIVAVRWNKNGRWCESTGCLLCRRIGLTLLDRTFRI